MKLLKTLDDKELYTRITPFLIVMHFIRGNFQQALECYEMLQKSTHKPVLPSSSRSSCSRRHPPPPTPATSPRPRHDQIRHQHGGTGREHHVRPDLPPAPRRPLRYMRRENDALEILQTVVSRSTMAANPN